MLYRNRRRKLSCPVKERYNLSTRACGIRTECTVVHTGGDAICKCPVNGSGVVGVAADVKESAVTSCGLTVCSPEEGNDLCTRDSCVWAEGLRAGTVGDAVFNSPQDGGIEVIIRTDIGEGVHLEDRLRAPRSSPEEGHNLRTRAGGVRAEGVAACAACA